MFLDEIVIRAQAGKGGDGVVRFRREKFVPKGGPDGGDGGRGGDVILEVRDHLNTLFHLRRMPHFRALDGESGKGNNAAGADARDLMIFVPRGTLVKDPATGQVLKDLKSPGDRIVLCRGGRGGHGNPHFANAERRTPRISEDGRDGERRAVMLELRLIADVGCVGLPNAGKSTLVSRCSAARPKIAPYPFTTLNPMLGIVGTDDFRSFVIADLPGLIEGAHEGAGLGDQFLRHIERTRLILHIIDGAPPAPPDPLTAYHTIRSELSAYSKTLASKPEIVVVNKIDLPEARMEAKRLRKELKRSEVHAIAAATGAGLPELMGAIFRKLEEIDPRRTAPVVAPSARPPVTAAASAPIAPGRIPFHRLYPGGPKPRRRPDLPPRRRSVRRPKAGAAAAPGRRSIPVARSKGAAKKKSPARRRS